ncbi:hypothetical protein EUTSA_v10005657mg [Eutrema salsugineum]|uniref:Prolamin-like domain-containing protein n=1 Tax=Eutrema salsugineum TaxID=72664 RepID=V4KK77_EUTSA|nr:uncharacterized protein LOC18012284 [Eutrema salsugineum]ESQ31594.1 hypothetical protein EUTSA_v10005657mg [Eutrema salsugineum]
MEIKSNAIASWILVIGLCAAVLVTPGVAQVQPSIPSIFPPISPIDPIKCWSSLFDVEGCVLEIYNSILSGQFGSIEATCCKTFVTIDVNYWPQMFPLNPFFPRLLKDSCAHIVPNSPTRK